MATRRRPAKVFKRGNEYLTDVLGTEVNFVVRKHPGEHATQCFASRQRDTSDNFRAAEAFANCVAILHSAEEQMEGTDSEMIYMATRLRSKAYERMVKWQDECEKVMKWEDE